MEDLDQGFVVAPFLRVGQHESHLDLLASGVLAVVLAVILWSSMPVTAMLLIGLLLGINLITEGMALAALVWTAKKA